ncbi:MAG: hypothetical protein QF705_03500, partial [Arenicellales bacterium]|nr:hypothetical protein [Arenicellales bacterium]
APEPCRYLFHITPDIPNGHIISSPIFYVESTAHNLLLLEAVFKHQYHSVTTECPVDPPFV